jgi:hypothetical protein
MVLNIALFCNHLPQRSNKCNIRSLLEKYISSIFCFLIAERGTNIGGSFVYCLLQISFHEKETKGRIQHSEFVAVVIHGIYQNKAPTASRCLYLNLI